VGRFVKEKPPALTGGFTFSKQLLPRLQTYIRNNSGLLLLSLHFFYQITFLLQLKNFLRHFLVSVVPVLSAAFSKGFLFFAAISIA
jgi:predicted RND superfamily exporter protein